MSRRVAAVLLAHTGQLRDAARTHGLEGYQQTATRVRRFGPGFDWLWRLHRRIGIAGPLAREISDRFEVQLAARIVLKNLAAFNTEQIGPLFGSGPSAALARQVEVRLVRD